MSFISHTAKCRLCPRCTNTPLNAINTKEGVEVDQCPTCKGVWLEPDEILAFTNRPQEVDRLLQKAGETPRKTGLRSPVSDVPLYEIDYPGGAIILVCPDSGGAWLDEPEMKALIQAGEPINLDLEEQSTSVREGNSESRTEELIDATRDIGEIVTSTQCEEGTTTSNEVDNPYAPPHSEVLPVTSMAEDAPTLAPRSLRASRGRIWISEAWSIFSDWPLAWMGASLLIMLFGIATHMLGSLIGIFLPAEEPWVKPVPDIVYSLFFPILLGGLMNCADNNIRNGKISLGCAWSGFINSPGRLGLLGIAGICAIAIPTIGFSVVFGYGLIPQLGVGILILVYILVSMALLFSPALIAVEGLSVLASLRLSFFGCLRNILPLLVWILLMLILALVGLIFASLFFPKAVTLWAQIIVLFFVIQPLAYVSLYFAYRDIYDPLSNDELMGM